jgi:elongation factor G
MSPAVAFVPVIELEIAPAAATDRARFLARLSGFAASDEQFRFAIDRATGGVKLAGIDESQLAEKIEALRGEHGEITIGPPQIAYRETITRRVEVDYAHKKQRGGSGEFAKVRLLCEPNSSDHAVVFRHQIRTGSLRDEYVFGVENGVEGALAAGVLAGCPVIGLSVSLVDGAYHDIDSSAQAFELAARAALREALQKAEPVLLEPVMRVAIVTPDEWLGVIISDLLARRGEISDRGQAWRSARLVAATVPAANLFGYAASLRQLTQGRASYTVRFDHYAAVSQPDDPKFRPAIGMRV